MKNKIIDPFNPHYKAHIQYDYGVKQNGRARAWVTYISYHWDALFPASHTLFELREKVQTFAEKNDLEIVMEQTTDKRFNYLLHGNNHTNCRIDGTGRLFDAKGFISPVERYRTP